MPVTRHLKSLSREGWGRGVIVPYLLYQVSRSHQKDQLYDKQDRSHVYLGLLGAAVIWPKYCRYGVKHCIIIQSINQSINGLLDFSYEILV